MRKRAVAAARGREAQLGLGLQVFGVRVKVAVRRHKKGYTCKQIWIARLKQLTVATWMKIYRLLKPWVKPKV